MKSYLDLLRDIIDNGIDQSDRTGVGTRSVFGRQVRFDLSKGFPAVTTKKLFFKPMLAELLFFISGKSDIKLLHEMNCHIWDANYGADYWAPKRRFDGDLGRVYGVQWRHWAKPHGGEVDQLAELIEKIKNNPTDRRMIVQAYNPGELDQMCLPPCHMGFDCYVNTIDKTLSLRWNQRSVDTFLGLPFNIASYAILTHMLAHVCGLKAGDLIGDLGNTHIYSNHFDQVNEQLQREPLPLPEIWLNPDVKSIFDFTMDDVKLIDYQHHAAIKAPMAV